MIAASVCTVSTISEIATRPGTEPVATLRMIAVSQMAPSMAHRPASRPASDPAMA
jgi:hypothetical protein